MLGWRHHAQPQLDFSTSAEILKSIQLLEEFKVKRDKWRTEVESLPPVEKQLQRQVCGASASSSSVPRADELLALRSVQRYLFPDDWLWTERIVAEFKSFEAILNTRLAQMHNQAILNQDEANIHGRVEAPSGLSLRAVLYAYQDSREDELETY
jgi:hypothetical protein